MNVELCASFNAQNAVMLLRSLLVTVPRRALTHTSPSQFSPFQQRHGRTLLTNHYYNFVNTRLYCTEKKKSDGNEENTGEKGSQKDPSPATDKLEVNNVVQNIKDTPGSQEKISTGEKSDATGAGDKTNTDNTNDNTSTGGEETKQEELPPWWGSLPLWKKILYPSIFISLFSFVTELIYASTLRSTLPYKQAMHVIRGVDEIEEAFGEIKEPKWYRFWEVLYGYWWVKANGYEGISKLWIPIVGVKEYKTDQVDKNGEPVMKQIFTRGRAYAEAKKQGAGQMEWVLTYLVVNGEKLGEVASKDEEWLDADNESKPKQRKGEMVLVNKHVQIEGPETDL